MLDWRRWGRGEDWASVKGRTTEKGAEIRMGIEHVINLRREVKSTVSYMSQICNARRHTPATGGTARERVEYIGGGGIRGCLKWDRMEFPGAFNSAR